jgi:hypothetical protein
MTVLLVMIVILFLSQLCCLSRAKHVYFLILGNFDEWKWIELNSMETCKMIDKFHKSLWFWNSNFQKFQDNIIYSTGWFTKLHYTKLCDTLTISFPWLSRPLSSICSTSKHSPMRFTLQMMLLCYSVVWECYQILWSKSLLSSRKLKELFKALAWNIHH